MRGRAWSSSGRKQVVYKPDQAVGRAWSGNLGDRDDQVDLIGSVNGDSEPSIKLRSHCWSNQLDHPDHQN